MKDSRHDIQSKEDVIVMVNSFYDKVNEDELLSYIFNDFAEVDWAHHLPIMYRFWDSLIFGSGTYKGNPFAKHIRLPIHKQHFQCWIQLFEQNIDEHFEGEIANHTKLRAQSIAHIFQNKLEYINIEK